MKYFYENELDLRYIIRLFIQFKYLLIFVIFISLSIGGTYHFKEIHNNEYKSLLRVQLNHDMNKSIDSIRNILNISLGTNENSNSPSETPPLNSIYPYLSSYNSNIFFEDYNFSFENSMDTIILKRQLSDLNFLLSRKVLSLKGSSVDDFVAFDVIFSLPNYDEKIIIEIENSLIDLYINSNKLFLRSLKEGFDFDFNLSKKINSITEINYETPTEKFINNIEDDINNIFKNRNIEGEMRDRLYELILKNLLQEYIIVNLNADKFERSKNNTQFNQEQMQELYLLESNKIFSNMNLLSINDSIEISTVKHNRVNLVIFYLVFLFIGLAIFILSTYLFLSYNRVNYKEN